MRVAVIGGGQIGAALILGLLGSGWERTNLVVVGRTSAATRSLGERFGIPATDRIADVVESADLIVLAVKPRDVDAVVTELAESGPTPDRGRVLVSLAAGVPIARLEAALPAGFPVARVMPNTSMMTGQGMSVIAEGRYLDAEHLRTVVLAFGAVGKVVTVDESQMDVVTAVSGSGPAYFFLVAEALIDGAVQLGLPRDLARQLVCRTMVGSAALLAGSGQSAAQLRAAVTAPGGATAAAVHELEKGAVRAALHQALDAAAHWSAE